MTPEVKVIKLWYSLKPKIQQIMWKDGLHPDTSTWAEIVAKVEVIEIADNVVDPQDWKPIQQLNHQLTTRAQLVKPEMVRDPDIWDKGPPCK